MSAEAFFGLHQAHTLVLEIVLWAAHVGLIWGGGGNHVHSLVGDVSCSFLSFHQVHNLVLKFV